MDPLGCTPASAGIVSVVLRDKQHSKGWIEYVIELKDLTLHHVPLLPASWVRTSVALGSSASHWQASDASLAGNCGESLLIAPVASGLKKPFCKPPFYAGALNNIACRGP